MAYASTHQETQPSPPPPQQAKTGLAGDPGCGDSTAFWTFFPPLKRRAIFIRPASQDFAGLEPSFVFAWELDVFDDQ
jgi:hypothetical protein